MTESVKIAVKPYKPMDISQLYSLQEDLKELTDAGYAKLRSEIVETGFAFMPHIWKDHNGKHWLVDGHQRWDALNRLKNEGFKIPKVPTALVEAKNMTEAKHRVLQGISAYGKITKIGFEHFTTKAKFDPKAIELRFDLPDFSIPHFVNSHYRVDPERDAKENDIPDTIKVVKARVGELYTLGNHRLLCGDSTDPKCLERLMNGERAVSCITDPPYSVNYQELKRAPQIRTRKQKGDTYIEPIDPASFLMNLFANIPSDLVVMTYPVDKHFQSLAKATELWDLLYECVWVKNHFAFTIGKRYQQQHEPILIFRRKNGKSTFNVPSDQSTVFTYDKPSKSPDHPTPKPVELYEKLIMYQSNDADLVYEPFGGSGTTLIAAEKTNRRCYVMEMAPQYCHVILDRWAQYTGKDPVREDGVAWSKVKTSRNIATKPRLAKS